MRTTIALMLFAVLAQSQAPPQPPVTFKVEVNKQQDNRIFGEFAEQSGAPYGLYRTFIFSPSMLPCNAPPWGTTKALDLFSGKQLWDVKIGSQADNDYFASYSTPVINGDVVIYSITPNKGDKKSSGTIALKIAKSAVAQFSKFVELIKRGAGLTPV